VLGPACHRNASSSVSDQASFVDGPDACSDHGWQMALKSRYLTSRWRADRSARRRAETVYLWPARRHHTEQSRIVDNSSASAAGIGRHPPEAHLNDVGSPHGRPPAAVASISSKYFCLVVLFGGALTPDSRATISIRHSASRRRAIDARSGFLSRGPRWPPGPNATRGRRNLDAAAAGSVRPSRSAK